MKSHTMETQRDRKKGDVHVELNMQNHRSHTLTNHIGVLLLLSFFAVDLHCLVLEQDMDLTLSLHIFSASSIETGNESCHMVNRLLVSVSPSFTAVLSSANGMVYNLVTPSRV
eukprot:m.96483 g.96483  ORF g.96483 m.96483 type:complete len:113 (+) comp26900_c0_seq3:1171-1509(+)